MGKGDELKLDIPDYKILMNIRDMRIYPYISVRVEEGGVVDLAFGRSAFYGILGSTNAR